MKARLMERLPWQEISAGQGSKHKSLPEFTLDILPTKSSYYVYILEGNDGNRYYGHTSNLVKRFMTHSKGRVTSTRNKRPLKLVYYEEFSSRREASKREMQLKNGRTRKETIQKLIESFPKAKCQGFNSAERLTSLALCKSWPH